MTRRAGAARVSDLIGAHMSIAGGLHRALERGRAVGCSVVQIFLKNQLQWKAKPLTEAEVRLWKQAQRETGIRLVFAHATYLINLGTPSYAEWRKGVAAFHDELERAEALGLPFVVIHPGSHKGSGREAGIARVTEALEELIRRTAGYRVKIVLENTAGAGDTIGKTFGDLAALLDRSSRPERLGTCLDTCHLFAAGYDIRTRGGYEQAMAECAATAGIRNVRAFHLNDAKAGLGSGLDRHQHIGRGHLGLAPFRFLLNDPRWRRIPKALETPKKPEPAADIENLKALRKLIARR